MPVNFERLHSPEVPVTYDNLASTPKLGEVVSGEEEGVVPGNSLIPQKIWQIMVNNDNPDPEILRDTKSWLARNIDYEYTLMSTKKSDEFVQKHYADEPRLLEIYTNLHNTGMKSDLLRYLILNVEGGVYADIDTVALQPVDAWVPDHLLGNIRLVVGPEFDQLDGPRWDGMAHFVQFGQWTIAAAAGHPVFRKLIDRALQAIEDLLEAYEVPIEDFRPHSHIEVVNSTGPIAFTELVFKHMQSFDPALKDTKALSTMKEPLVFGDTLVLTIDGFGMGQQHSGSTNDGTIPKDAFVSHNFGGTWGKGDQMDHSGEKGKKKGK
ncbi:unnamed protein product [Clonostachys rosea f. rosea IK726]|uniref:Initiation-specific alpha-1,6-mannosyltransferase n=2 Tax=Bionectria ochroleuca TaxID=29856 RepID=A0A0B7K736_BIOOC|nr:unnamed protein product [Clonostachys rosea f. rosea IK726]